MKRRNFIKISGLSTGTVLTGGTAAGFLASCSGCNKEHHIGLMTEAVTVTEGDFSRLLSYPAQAGANHTLTAQATVANIKGTNIPLLGYQPNSLLGPSFRINRGDVMNVLLQNNLSEHTNIHWHGLKIPALMDGHPDQLASAGGTFRYQFTINQRAGLSWYHPHPHEMTGKQVFQGLAGMFIINDTEEAALSLPSGQYELPLVIQDKRISSNGITYNPSMEEVMAGYMGESIIVNGIYSPYTEVATRYYRLRILNGSNARIYRLAFLNGKERLSYMVIGTDGGLIERPEKVSEAFIAPGERLDVLFDAGQAQPGDDVFLKSLAFDAMENEGEAGSMPGMGESTSRLEMGAAFNILKLSVITGARVMARLPNTLSVITPIALDGARKRNIKLSLKGMTFLINGRRFNMDEIAFDVKRGSKEIWSISNPKLGMPHPIHLHGFAFQVLERLQSPKQISALAKFGKGRTVSDLGWKDTVLVWPGETVRVAIDFTHDFPGDQTYMVHCHNLEHEDAGMMINYRVVG